MQINFTGNKPDKKTYSYSVKNNNNSNIIIFILDKVQEDLDLSSLSCFVKVHGSEIDKDVPTIEIEEDKIKVNWTLLRKHTESRVLSIQLQFEGTEDVVWQSEILQLVLSDTIKADEYIENKYPAVLTNHEARLLNVEIENQAQEAEITALDEKIAQALAGVFHYKGSVDTYNDLPTENQEVGDTYNILDTGDNYTWDGEKWDKLSGIVDLTAYYTSEETDTLLDEKADKEELAYFVDLDSNQSIGGYKTFNNGVKIKGNIENGYNQICFALANGQTLVMNKIAPMYDDNLDFGSKTNKWKHAYFSGGTICKNINQNNYWRWIGDSAGNFLIQVSTDDTNYTNVLWVAPNQKLYTKDHIPLSNGIFDLGANLTRWKDLYLSGKIYTSWLDNESDNISVTVKNGGALRPSWDNHYDLGQGGYAWRNLYVKGVLSDGTNEVSIADLKALIDYAKSQGWIS